MTITRTDLRTAVDALLVTSPAGDAPQREVVLDFPNAPGVVVGDVVSPEVAERFRVLLAERLTAALADKLGLPAEGPLRPESPWEQRLNGTTAAPLKAKRQPLPPGATCSHENMAECHPGCGHLSCSCGLEWDEGAESEPFDEPECPGNGKCHGCLKWCSTCGDVAHVCDARLEGRRCDEHPVPAPWVTIRAARHAAEQKIADGKRAICDGEAQLQGVIDAENARRAYDRQMAEDERKVFEVTR